MVNVAPTRQTMRWMLALVAVIVAGLLGMNIGAQRERDSMALALLAQEEHVAAIEEDYQTQISQLRTQRDIADASNVSLQKTLQQLQSESLEQQSTQRLYDNIEGINRNSGLDVDTVTRVTDENGKETALHITVVQARGRDRVKGQIGVALIGEKDGEAWQEVIAEVGSDTAVAFNMRFFQTVIVPLPEHNALIDIVEIHVKSDETRHKPVNQAMNWAGILEE